MQTFQKRDSDKDDNPSPSEWPVNRLKKRVGNHAKNQKLKKASRMKKLKSGVMQQNNCIFSGCIHAGWLGRVVMQAASFELHTHTQPGLMACKLDTFFLTPSMLNHSAQRGGNRVPGIP